MSEQDKQQKQLDTLKGLMNNASYSRGVGEIKNDLWQDIKSGLVAPPQAGVGLLSLMSGGHAGKFVEDNIWDMQKTKENIHAQKSATAHAQQRQFEDAQGFGAKLGTIVKNPMMAVDAAIESTPSMLVGGRVGRGIGRAAKIKSTALRAGIGEGTMMAGSAAENMRSQNDDGLLTGKEAIASIGTGVFGAGFGYGGSKLAGKLGIGDVDSLLAGGVREINQNATQGGFTSGLKGIGKGAVSEGVFEELPQTLAETALDNWANGLALTDDMAGNAAMGLAAGATMGAVMGGATSKWTKDKPAQNNPDPSTPQLGYNPSPVAPTGGAVAMPSNPSGGTENGAILSSSTEKSTLPQAVYTLANAINDHQGVDEPSISLAQNLLTHIEQNGIDVQALTDSTDKQEALAQVLKNADPAVFANADSFGEFVAQNDYINQFRATPSQISNEGAATPTTQPIQAPTASDDRADKASRGIHPNFGERLQKPSEKLGLDPNAGVLSKSAVVAVDSGASAIGQALHAQVQQSTQEPSAYQDNNEQAQNFVNAPKIIGKQNYIQNQNERLPTQLMVVEADTLTPSTDNTQNQARDRNRTTSRLQVDTIANNLDPAQLTDSTTMTHGSPTITDDGTIIAGNGRTMALKQAYAQGRGEEYRQMLATKADEYGLDKTALAQMKHPVLVKSVGNIHPDKLRLLALNSNETGTMTQSAFETARADVGRVAKVNLDNLHSDDTGNINTPSNKHVINQFVSQFPIEQQNALRQADGTLSKQGLERFENALLLSAYGDNPTTQAILESTDVALKNAIKALASTAPSVAKTKQSIQDGVTPNDDIARDITEALSVLAKLRRDNVRPSDYLAQTTLLEDELSDTGKRLLDFMDKNIRSVVKIRQLLYKYYDNLSKENLNQEDMFGKPAQSKQTRLNNALQELGYEEFIQPINSEPTTEHDPAKSGQASTGQSNTPKSVGQSATLNERPQKSESNGQSVGRDDEGVSLTGKEFGGNRLETLRQNAIDKPKNALDGLKDKRIQKAQTKADTKLRADWGVETIGRFETTDEFPADLSKENSDPVKEAFLKDSKSYLGIVQSLMEGRGYSLYKNSKGKPEKISVNTGGSGGVTLVMHKDRVNVYVQVSVSSMRSKNGHPQGVQILYRAYKGDYKNRFSGGYNHFDNATLSAGKLAQTLDELAQKQIARNNVDFSLAINNNAIDNLSDEQAKQVLAMFDDTDNEASNTAKVLTKADERPNLTQEQENAKQPTTVQPPSRVLADTPSDGVGADTNGRTPSSVHLPSGEPSQSRDTNQPAIGDDRKRSTGVLSDGDKAGLSRGVTRQEIANHRGKTDLDTLYQVATSRSDVNNSFVEFGAIDKDLAQRIKNDTGFDVQGWQVALDETYLRHILKNHGNEQSESKRGQATIGLQDFARIMEVVYSYDKASAGDDSIIFEKNIDGKYTLVTTLRTGRKKLAVTTLYKSKKSSTQVLVAPEQSQSTDETPETLLGRKTDDSLPNPNNAVNTTKALDNAIQATNQADFADYIKNHDSLAKATKAYFDDHLKGKAFDTVIGKVHILGSSWQKKLKFGINSDPLQAYSIPHIPNILTTGDYEGRNELTKERKDDFVAFHSFVKEINANGTPVFARLLVGEKSNKQFEFVVYSIYPNKELAQKNTPNSSGLSEETKALLGDENILPNPNDTVNNKQTPTQALNNALSATNVPTFALSDEMVQTGSVKDKLATNIERKDSDSKDNTKSNDSQNRLMVDDVDYDTLTPSQKSTLAKINELPDSDPNKAVLMQEIYALDRSDSDTAKDERSKITKKATTYELVARKTREVSNDLKELGYDVKTSQTTIAGDGYTATIKANKGDRVLDIRIHRMMNERRANDPTKNGFFINDGGVSYVFSINEPAIAQGIDGYFDYKTNGSYGKNRPKLTYTNGTDWQEKMRPELARLMDDDPRLAGFTQMANNEELAGNYKNEILLALTAYADKQAIKGNALYPHNVGIDGAIDHSQRKVRQLKQGKPYFGESRPVFTPKADTKGKIKDSQARIAGQLARLFDDDPRLKELTERADNTSPLSQVILIKDIKDYASRQAQDGNALFNYEVIDRQNEAYHDGKMKFSQMLGVVAPISEQAKILQGKPVSVIDEQALDMPLTGGFGAISAWATALFAKQGGKAVNPVLGEVTLNHRSVKDSLAHGKFSPFKNIAFAGVKDVLEKGVLIATDVNEFGEDSFYVSAPITINGRENILTVTVHKDSNSQRMYLHSVMVKEGLLKPRVSATLETTSRTHYGSLTSTDIHNILQKALTYNPTHSHQGGRFGTTFDEIVALLNNRFGKDTIKALQNNGSLKILSLNQAQDEFGSIPTNADGFYVGNTAYLIHDNIHPDMVIATFLHELGGHGGLQTLMSDTAYQSLLKEFDSLVAKGDTTAIKAKTLAHKHTKSNEQAKEEYLPYLITLASRQKDQQSGIKRLMNRMLLAIKSFVRNKLGISLPLTAQDIVALAEKSVKDRASGQSKQSQNSVRFSQETPDAELALVRKKYKGTEQWLKAPNGEPTNLTTNQWLQVRTPSFKAWFGDWENDPDNASQVLDDNGEPLVVYHGTKRNNRFYAFENNSQGLHFGTKEQAKARNAGRLIQAFLNIRDIDREDDQGSDWNFTIKYAPQRGVDGFVYENEVEGEGDSYIVLKPNQVKSAKENIGTFDPNNDDIRFSLDDSDDGAFAKINIQPKRNAVNFIQAWQIVGGMLNKPLKNKQSGMVATLSRRSLDKMLSGKAVAKSTDSSKHIKAVVNIDVLFENAVLGWVEKDKNNADNVLGVHRFFAPLLIDDKAYLIKLTVKELLGSDGNRIYSVETLDIEKSSVPNMVATAQQSELTTRYYGASVAILARAIDDYNKENNKNSPDNFDIKFSRMADLYAQSQDTTQKAVDSLSKVASEFVNNPKAFVSENTKQAVKNGVSDHLGKFLQFLGRRQLTELYGKKLDGLVSYNNRVAQMDADSNENAFKADTLVNQWSKVKDDKALAWLMSDVTLFGIDPSVPRQQGANAVRYGQLKARYERLSDEAKGVFNQARDDYQAHYQAMHQAMSDRIKRNNKLSDERKAKLIAKLDKELQATQKAFFPLTRFGDYVVVVKDSNGNVVNISRAETRGQADSIRQQLIKDNPNHSVGQVVLGRELDIGKLKGIKGLASEFLNDDLGLDDELQKDVINALLDREFATNNVMIKNTAGFSQNARRAYAYHMTRGGHYIAKLRHTDQLKADLERMQATVDDNVNNPDFDHIALQRVVDEMNKRHRLLLNPPSSPISTMATATGFMWYMGLSPASALVNLSQTLLVGLPMMGAKYGLKNSVKMLVDVSALLAKNKRDLTNALIGDEKKAFLEAVRRGVIDMTAAHDLAGVANGEDSGTMAKIKPVMKVASAMFHAAEKFNRQVTFMASYRLAIQKGLSGDEALEEAIDVTYKSHFDYASSNRPRFMQGNWQRVLFLFKQYGQNMIYTLVHNTYQSFKGDTPQERAEARKIMAGILAGHAMTAGVLGLPVAITAPFLAAFSALGGDDDDELTDNETEFRNALSILLGDDLSEVIAKGLPRGAGVDLSGRVGLDSLIFPRLQDGLEGQRWGENMMVGAMGAVAGIPVSMAKGVQQMRQGQTAQGIENMLPKALKDPMKAYRYMTEGNVDKSGIEIVAKENVGYSDIIQQAAGFRSGKFAQASEVKSAIYQAEQKLNATKKQLKNDYSQAYRDDDKERMDKIWGDIQTFNRKYPTQKITKPDLMRSIKARQKRIDNAKDGIYLPKSREHLRAYGAFGVE